MSVHAAALPTTDDPTPAELIAARPALSMHAMDGLLFAGVPLNAIADALGTPTWVYAAPVMRARYRALTTALTATGLDAHVHYAVKANDHLAVLDVFGAEGSGADVVSEGELRRALHAGIPASRIVFSGVGKTVGELRLALAEDIAEINVESAEELAMLSAVATTMGRTARVALRVNPDVDAATHAKISTGRSGDKFGIPHDEIVGLYAHAAGLPGILPVGLAVHIGSQILTMAPYRAAYARIAGLVTALRAAGQTVETVDCGGGLGVGYRDQTEGNPAALAGAIAGAVRGLDVRIAMNDLVRPAMYDAWHGIVPVSATNALGELAPADIVGPVCESGDTFARSRLLPPVTQNARVAILDAGAYGAVMSSTYNARPLAAQVLIDKERWTVIRDRQDHAALWAAERVPGRAP
jgi:diaminopimelate decarboxylase